MVSDNYIFYFFSNQVVIKTPNPFFSISQNNPEKGLSRQEDAKLCVSTSPLFYSVQNLRVCLIKYILLILHLIH